MQIAAIVLKAEAAGEILLCEGKWKVLLPPLYNDTACPSNGTLLCRACGYPATHLDTYPHLAIRTHPARPEHVSACTTLATRALYYIRKGRREEARVGHTTHRSTSLAVFHFTVILGLVRILFWLNTKSSKEL